MLCLVSVLYAINQKQDIKSPHVPFMIESSNIRTDLSVLIPYISSKEFAQAIAKDPGPI